MLESGENYLETILRLEQAQLAVPGQTPGKIRSIDVCRALGVSRPSVSRAVSVLRRLGYLRGDVLHLCLTEKGRAKAQEVLERHTLLTRFFVQTVGIDAQTAAQDACRFEHDISDELFAKIKAYLQTHPAQ